jgi:hypothetical protein
LCIDAAKTALCRQAKQIPIKMECVVVPITIKVGRALKHFSEKRVKEVTHRTVNVIKEYIYINKKTQ